MGNVHRLIAFDLDGTLIDSRRDLADTANDLIAELGGTPLPEATITRMVGEGVAVLVRRALAEAKVAEPPDSVTRFLQIYDRQLLVHTRVYAGIEAAVRLARDQARVVVLTNKPRTPSEKILEGLGLRSLFDEVVGGDGPLPRKPDPAALLALMDQTGADQSTTLLVGDSPIDYQTAVNAGVRCCLVSFGFGFANFASAPPGDHAWIANDAAALSTVIQQFAATASR